MAINELYEELSEFEEKREVQRRELFTTSKEEAIKHEYDLLVARYENMDGKEFEKMYGRAKSDMKPEEYPEHELLDMYMSRSYLNTNVPITKIEESIGPMNDPLSTEVRLYQRGLATESSEAAKKIKVRKQLEQKIKQAFAYPSQKLPELIKEAQFSTKRNTLDALLEAEELRAILDFDRYVQAERRTMHQLFAGISDDKLIGYDDPSYALITKADLVEEITHRGDAEQARRKSRASDYDITA
jgi:hypothetical protein